MDIRPVKFAVDGIDIVGELCLPENSRKSSALCICHGIPSGKAADPNDRGYRYLAEKFCSSGFATLIFNFRGTGLSGGNFDMIGWARDLECAIGYLHACPQVDQSRVYLMGFSGGAAASTYVAAHDVRVARVVLCACPAEFHRIVGEKRSDFSIEHFRNIGLIRDNDFPRSPENWISGFKEIAPIRWVDRVAPRPLLILHGKDDDLVGEDQARLLYEKACEPKEIAVVEGAGHKLRLSDEAMDIAMAWLKRL